MRIESFNLSHAMKILLKYWYIIVLMAVALTVNENLVQWALAVRVGGFAITAGFKDAFEHFTLVGYLFITAFRLVPYVLLGTALFILSRTRLKDYVFPVFAGGLIGILAMIVWGSWMSLRPFYTDEHVSSTTAIAFLFIPMYAVPAGAAGALLLALLYTPFRFMVRRKVREQPPADGRRMAASETDDDRGRQAEDPALTPPDPAQAQSEREAGRDAVPPPLPPTPAGAGDTIGGYRLTRLLGAGAHGEVFEAENTLNRQRVALRVLKAPTGQDWPARFSRVTAALMDMDHAGLVKILHAGVENDVYYFTLGLVQGPGGTRGPTLAEPGSLPGLTEANALRLAITVCDALDHAHRRGVPHGRLAPDKVFVVPSSPGIASPESRSRFGPTPEARISGLGLAVLFDRSDPGSELSPDTLNRMIRADVHAFGEVLALLRDRTPIGRPPRKRGLRSRAWDAVIARCLADTDDPGFDGMADIRGALENLLRSIRRRRQTLAYAGLCAGAILLTGGAMRLGRLQSARRPAPPRTLPVEEAQPTGPWTAGWAWPAEGESYILGIGLQMQWIPPGRFRMGSTAEERAWAVGPEGGATPNDLGRESDPVDVVIPRGFWMARTTITRAMFLRYRFTLPRFDSLRANRAWVINPDTGQFHWQAGANYERPGFRQTGDHPVVCMSWNDAMTFCAWLNELEREDGRLPPGYAYRLPTEAEWEYAARAGATGPFWWGDDLQDARGRLNAAGTDPWLNRPAWTNHYAWADGFVFTSPVIEYGARGRNAFGLADMAGNVWEWCAEEADVSAGDGARAHPEEMRPVRGGAFHSPPGLLRCAAGSAFPAGVAAADIGMRIVLAPVGE